ncbi:MAG: OB-fold nucleic acid binding domain-containing protein [Candidatus Aenigmatarchaeota archaeon]|jgi:replication factor A1
MKIAELKNGMTNVTLEAKVTDKSERKSVLTRYGRREVANITLEDETGEIKASLWEDQIDKVNVGDNVKISGAFVSEFKDELQLNIPKRGKIEVI